MAAININHKTETITTENDSVLTIGINGGLKIGDGSNISAIDNKGVLRFNDVDDKLEISDGSDWREAARIVSNITSDQIANDAIITNKINNGAVTEEKIEPTFASDLLRTSNNLSEFIDPSIVRDNLGLGTAATYDVGTAANNIVQLDGDAKLPANLGGGTAGWTEEAASVIFGAAEYFEVFGDKTDIYVENRAVRLTQTSSGIGYVVTSTLDFSGNTVVEVTGIDVDAGLSKVEYGIEVGSESYNGLPYPIEASKYLKAKSDGTGYEALTAAEVLADIDAIKPAFLATRSATASNVTGDGTTYTAIYDNEVFDDGNNYNHTTGVFTAPIKGSYFFCTNNTITGLTVSHTTGVLIFNASNRSSALNNGNVGAMRNAIGVLNITGSVLIDMDAGDACKIDLQVSGGTKVVGLYSTGGVSYFSGSLVKARS